MKLATATFLALVSVAAAGGIWAQDGTAHGPPDVAKRAPATVAPPKAVKPTVPAKAPSTVKPARAR